MSVSRERRVGSDTTSTVEASKTCIEGNENSWETLLPV